MTSSTWPDELGLPTAARRAHYALKGEQYLSQIAKDIRERLSKHHANHAKARRTKKQ